MVVFSGKRIGLNEGVYTGKIGSNGGVLRLFLYGLYGLFERVKKGAHLAARAAQEKKGGLSLN